MGQRSGIFRELLGFQVPHLGDALDGARTLVGGELVVAVDRQAFLEAELEPVAAGHAVAGPVVEIFVGDDRLDIRIVLVGGDFRVGQHVFVVEDVEPLVLHGAHVEVGDGDDHEDVEVVFAAEHLLVPFHGALQRVHGIGRARLLAVLDIDLQRHLAAGHGDERVFHHAEVAGDQREEVGGLRVRVEPSGEVLAFAIARAAEEIAVGKKQRATRLVGDDVDRVDGQHVRPVGEIGDAAEALGLALRAVDAVGAVEAHQLRVGLGIDHRGDGDLEGLACRQVADRQALGRRVVARLVHLHLVEEQARHDELVAVEDERGGRIGAFAAVEDQPRLDLRFGRVEFEGQVDAFENEVSLAIICQMDDPAVLCPHGMSRLLLPRPVPFSYNRAVRRDPLPPNSTD